MAEKGCGDEEPQTKNVRLAESHSTLTLPDHTMHRLQEKLRNSCGRIPLTHRKHTEVMAFRNPGRALDAPAARAAGLAACLCEDRLQDTLPDFCGHTQDSPGATKELGRRTDGLERCGARLLKLVTPVTCGLPFDLQVKQTGSQETYSHAQLGVRAQSLSMPVPSPNPGHAV